MSLARYLSVSPETRRILRFIVVGVVNTLFGYLMFAFLVAVGMPAQPALVVAFMLGVLWNYQTHARIVFAARGLGHLPAYVLVYMAIYGLNALSLSELMAAGLSAAMAQAVFLPVGTAISYVGIGRVLTGRFPWSPALQ